MSQRKVHGLDAALALEILAALALSIFGISHFVLHLDAMSTTGLWNDEIASIRLFSSQGLWTTLTSYPAPNNHIFFNALSALMSWSDPYAPASARFWSFVATGAIGAAGTYALARRRSFLEAGLFVHLLFMSREFVALSLQARGYGVLSLFVLLSGILAWRHEEAPNDRRSLVGLGIVSWLGIWTIPTYALFAGPVIALTALSGSRRQNAAIGLATVAVTAIVYAPVATDVLSASRHYSREWGHQLDSVSEVIGALRLYLFHDESFVHGPNDTAIMLMLVALVAVAFRSSKSPEGRAARTMIVSALVLILACFALGTPPPRTLAPTVVAIAFGAVLLLRDRLRPLEHGRTRAILAVGLALVLIPHDRETLEDFHFVPRERWKSIAEFIDRVLPEDMDVAVRYRSDQLSLYAQRPDAFLDDVVPEDFYAGRAAVLRSGHDPRSENDPLAEDPRLAPIRFKQNRGHHQTLYVAAPESSLIANVTLVERVERDGMMDLAAATDGDLDTRAVTERSSEKQFRYVELHCDLEDGYDLRSVLLHFDEEASIGRLKVDYRLEDGTILTLPQSEIFRWGSAVAVRFETDAGQPFQRGRIESLIMRIRPHVKDGRRLFSLREIWAYPERLDDPATPEAHPR